MQQFDGPFDCDVIMKKSANKFNAGPLAIRQLPGSLSGKGVGKSLRYRVDIGPARQVPYGNQVCLYIISILVVSIIHKINMHDQCTAKSAAIHSTETWNMYLPLTYNMTIPGSDAWDVHVLVCIHWP